MSTPAYDLGKIIQTRDRIVSAVRLELQGKPLDAEGFSRLLDLVQEVLPQIDRALVRESLRALAGTRPTIMQLQDAVHRLCGNLHRLRKGHAVYAWSRQADSEWAPVQVMACRYEAARKNQGARLTFKVMAGSPASLLFSRWWSNGRLRAVARELGFSRPRSLTSFNDSRPVGLVYADPAQYVTLRFLALFEPDACTDGLNFFKVKTTATLDDWNREQLRFRSRTLPGYECPQGFPLSVSCHRCSIGYQNCPAGTHRFDYTEGSCSHCQRCDALFDPELPPGRCVDCVRRQVKVAGKSR